MDESLKARLIGATVLVIVAVLLIPELLSGRKAREPAVEEVQSAPGTRTFTIELGAAGGNGGSPSPARTTAAPVTASRPPPASGAPSSEATAVAMAPAAESGEHIAATIPEPAPAAAPDATAVPLQPAAGPAATAGDGWAVQVGAFGSAESASRVVRELGAAGFEAHVAPVTRRGRTLHRVRVGHEGDKAAAERLAQQLKARGLPATVVEDD